MSPAYIAIAVTVTIFIGGLVYHAGQATQRLLALEQWRAELRDDIRTLVEKLNHIESMIQNGR